MAGDTNGLPPPEPSRSGLAKFGRSPKERLVIVAKVQQAVALRKSGCTYAQIGAHMKCSDVMASKYVKKGISLLAGKTREDARTVKTLILQRADAMTLKLFAKLDSKNSPPSTAEMLSIIDRIGRIDDRRAKLEGLIGGVQVNAPVQIKVDTRRQAARQMDPLMANMTLEEKVKMLQLIETAEQRAAAASNPPPVVVIES